MHEAFPGRWGVSQKLIVTAFFVSGNLGSRPLRRRPGHSQAESKGGEGSHRDAQNCACSSTSALGDFQGRDPRSRFTERLSEMLRENLTSKEDPSNPPAIVAVVSLIKHSLKMPFQNHPKKR